MSLHTNIIAIYGDHLAELPSFFEENEYAVLSVEELPLAETLNRLKPRPNTETESKIAYVENGWTVLLDPAMLFGGDDAALAQLSGQYGGEVCHALCDGSSGTYKFAIFERGRMLRSLEYSGGALVRNDGAPIPEEAGIDIEHLGEDETVELLKRTAVDYGGLEKPRRFTIYTLADAAGDTPIATAEPDQKPWWKVW